MCLHDKSIGTQNDSLLSLTRMLYKIKIIIIHMNCLQVSVCVYEGIIYIGTWFRVHFSASLNVLISNVYFIPYSILPHYCTAISLSWDAAIFLCSCNADCTVLY